MASSSKERIAPIEGLEAFFEPVELYNHLNIRASEQHPLFLKRCLSYKVPEKFEGRVQVAVILPVSLNAEVKNQTVYPICVLLAQEVNHGPNTESEFRFGRARILYTDTTGGENHHVRANFMLPKMEELSKLDTSSLFVMFIKSAKITPECMDLSSFPTNVEGDCLVGGVSVNYLAQIWSDIESWSLGQTSDTCLSVHLDPCKLKSSLSEGAFVLTPTRRAKVAKDTRIKKLKDTRIKKLKYTRIKKFSVVFSAWETGMTERNVNESNLARIRSGNVAFNYRKPDNKLITTEVTEDFSCPFCMMKCVNFKGLGCHLTASHDLVNFEFPANEENHYVNVFPKLDTGSSKIVDPGDRQFAFCAKSRRCRKSKTVVRNAKNTHRPVLDLEAIASHSHTHADPDCPQSLPGNIVAPPATPQDGHSHTHADPDCALSLPGSTVAPPTTPQDGHSHTHADPDCQQSSPGSVVAPPTTPQDGLSLTHADPDCPPSLPGSVVAPPTTPQDCNTSFDFTDKPVDPDCVQSVTGSCLPSPEILQLDNAFRGLHANDPDFVHSAPEPQPPRANIQHAETSPNLMREGRFFHSGTWQPMSLEEVIDDHDSENEVDYDFEDIEDQRMLANYSNVSKDEKHVMLLWNSFIRKNRIQSRRQILSACEAFTNQHGRDFVQEPALLWCWRMFMIKLYNEGLLDGKTMNTCNIILNGFGG